MRAGSVSGSAAVGRRASYGKGTGVGYHQVPPLPPAGARGLPLLPVLRRTGGQPRPAGRGRSLLIRGLLAMLVGGAAIARDSLAVLP